MVSLSEQKYHLFHLISSIDNPRLLKWLETELIRKQKELAKETGGTQAMPDGPELQHKLRRPIQKKMDPEALKKAQNWKGHDEEALRNAIHELNVEEPIEELLSQLAE